VWVPDERRLWRTIRTTEFDESWEEASAELSRPSDHMSAIERAIRRRPVTVSTPFVEENQRVVATKDPNDGKEIWVFFRMNPETRECELGWVHVRDLVDEPG
jgi:hypothetical protein